MEDFFTDPRLHLIFKLLAPIIIEEGHNICESRQGNRARRQGIVSPLRKPISEDQIQQIQEDFKNEVERLRKFSDMV
jgi:hypothetical protein